MAEDAKQTVLLLAGRFEVRGTSAYTLRLAETLPEHGFKPRIAFIDARQAPDAARRKLDIREYAYLRVPVWGRVVRQGIYRDLAGDPPDLIHVQSRDMLRPGQWLANRLGRPLILTVHDYLRPRERMRFDCRCGKRIIAVSRAVREDLLRRTGLPVELMSVVHSGVESEVDESQTPVLDPAHIPVVGAAGPLEGVKGFPFFLGAAQRVLQNRDNVEFLIAGAGAEEVNLRRMTRDLGVAAHVTFFSSLRDFSQSLRAMDIFCLPSLQQGLGTIMLQAMSQGKPVIATNVGGVDAVVTDGETGLLVSPSNSAQLAERINELLDDPVRARAIAESGRRLVESHFNVETMVRLTVDVYKNVLESTNV